MMSTSASRETAQRQTTVEAISMTVITAFELTDLITHALVVSCTSDANAASVARALVAAEIDGQSGHGISRVASYAAQAKVGKVNGQAVPTATATKPGALLVDAAHGFAYPALDLAVGHLPAMAKTNGIATAAITRSHHAGVAGHTVERLAEQGMVALMFANTPAAMAATGGSKALFGTNPLAFACPIAGRPPLVVDLALSTVARGKIVVAARDGKAIPLGWAVDSAGQPTTDANAALAGMLLPLGGAKGAALALMVEVLAAALTGANFAFEASPFLDDAGAFGAGNGGFGTERSVLQRVAVLAAAIEADGARLPGSRRHALREKVVKEGLAVDADVLNGIKTLAGNGSDRAKL
jgi:(2R)-3-sulfolactate dehydrogenase (NADP+)